MNNKQNTDIKPGKFNKEDKITWTELAPSLQALFKKLESEIKNLANYVHSTGLGTDTRLDNLFANSDEGQVVKVDTVHDALYPHDNFLMIRFSTSPQELSNEKSVTDNIQSFSEFTSSWTKNGAAITENTINITNGFYMSNLVYTDYVIQYKIQTDPSSTIKLGLGVYDGHKIEFIKKFGKNNFLGIVYDYDDKWEKIADDHILYDSSDFDKLKNINGQFYITIARQENSFYFAFADQNKKNFPTMYFLYEKPFYKDGSMEDNVYNMIQGLFNSGTNVMGSVVGTASLEIVFQKNILPDNNIYSLDTDYMYQYNFSSRTWENVGRVHENLSNKIFIYNNRTDKLYFYDYWNKYVRIK